MSDAAVSNSGLELSLSTSTSSSSTSANSDLISQLHLVDICECRRRFQVDSQPISIIDPKNSKRAAHSYTTCKTISLCYFLAYLSAAIMVTCAVTDRHSHICTVMLGEPLIEVHAVSQPARCSDTNRDGIGCNQPIGMTRLPAMSQVLSEAGEDACID